MHEHFAQERPELVAGDQPTISRIRRIPRRRKAVRWRSLVFLTIRVAVVATVLLWLLDGLVAR
jgi:hypothetical protein